MLARKKIIFRLEHIPIPYPYPNTIPSEYFKKNKKCALFERFLML